MNEIGGFFGLELKLLGHYHHESLKLNTLRNALCLFLKTRQIQRLFLPALNCPDIERHIRCHYPNLNIIIYHINNHLEPIIHNELLENDLLYYVNLFGLKCQFSHSSPRNFIIDNAHSFYSLPRSQCATLYSARKFFGVPDGAYLYTTEVLNADIAMPHESFNRASYLFKRIDCSAQEAYKDYLYSEQTLALQPLAKMSNLSNALLNSIDYKTIAGVRRLNFEVLHEALKATNKYSPLINAALASKHFIPFSYPYNTREGHGLKCYLREKKVFIPSYWDELLSSNSLNTFERRCVQDTVHLPIDQRYDVEDMNFILMLLNIN